MSAAACGANAAVVRALGPILVSHVPYAVPYAVGLSLQEHMVQRRAHARARLRAADVAWAQSSHAPTPGLDDAYRVATTDFLLLLEHTPVYTLGRRDDAAVGAAIASGLAADVVQTQRGGLLTYHGPGQLTGYPIVDIGRMNEALRTALQAPAVSIATQDAPSDQGQYTGIWVSPSEKIASLGVHVRHRVTSHGFGLNVRNEALKGFKNIIACGLPDVRLTSVEEQRGPAAPLVTVPQMSTLVADALATALQRTVVPAPASSILYVPATRPDGTSVVDYALVDGVQVGHTHRHSADD